jgi:hypothetical protein
VRDRKADSLATMPVVSGDNRGLDPHRLRLVRFNLLLFSTALESIVEASGEIS